MTRLLSSRSPPRLDHCNVLDNVHYKSHNAFNRTSRMPVGPGEDHKRKIHARSLIGERIRGSQPEKAGLIRRASTALTSFGERMLESALAIPNDKHPDTPLRPGAAT